jgi:hypothetical protein
MGARAKYCVLSFLFVGGCTALNSTPGTVANPDGGPAGVVGTSGGKTGAAGSGASGAAGSPAAGAIGTAGSGTAGSSGGAGSAAAGTSGGAGAAGAGAGGSSAGASGTAGGGTAGTSDAAGNTGTTGSGGSGGAIGAAGTSGGGFTGPFTCTLLAGLLLTRDWFLAGFENDGVDGTTWEGMFPHYGYIDIWAQDPPAGFAWTAPISSACTNNALNPDRVLFTAWSWELAYMEDIYVADVLQDIMEFKKNFPNIKRFELSTIVRCPGNEMCNPNATVPPIAGITDHNAAGQDCYVAPSQDDALAKVAAMFPDWAFVAPKFEWPSCPNPINGVFPDKQNPTIAKTIASYYIANP